MYRGSVSSFILSSFFLWLGLGIGIDVLGAMGINREAARSALSGEGRESGIPGAVVPSDVTVKTTRQVRC